LLLDFGGGAAAVEAAGQISIAGNVAFTAAHQILIFNVARAYFTLDGSDAALRAARQALADAKVVQQSAEALFGRGLDTIVSKREETAAALKERTDQALREVALACDQVDTGLQQYDAAIALQIASDTAFRSASDAYAHGVGTLTDATSAQTGLATARAAVARAHAQSLINAAALAFATGELTSSSDFASPTP
jgi:outer membrane protein TolC